MKKHSKLQRDHKKVVFVCSTGKRVGRKKPGLQKLLVTAKNLTGESQRKSSIILKTGIKLQIRLKAQGQAIPL